MKKQMKIVVASIVCLGLLVVPFQQVIAQTTGTPVGGGGGGGVTVGDDCYQTAAADTQKCLTDVLIAAGIAATACLVTGPGTVVCDPAVAAATAAAAAGCGFSGAAEYALCELKKILG